MAKLGLRKLETSFYRTVQRYYYILNRLSEDHECERRMDFTTATAALRYVARQKIYEVTKSVCVIPNLLIVQKETHA